MIESSFRPRFGSYHRSGNYHEISLASPSEQLPMKNNYVFSPANTSSCLSGATSQDCFYGAGIYAGPSDASAVASPENYVHNSATMGPTSGLTTPQCMNGVEPSPQYPALSPVYDMKGGSNDMWQLGYGQPSPYLYDNACGPQFPYPRYCGMDFDESVRRKNATRESTNTLKSWLQEHKKNPYPTKGEKIMLAIITKMTLTQVSTWFANARRRLKKENKMTWVPKNRSSDASSSGDSKKNTDDEDPDDVDDDVEALLSQENDGRRSTLQQDEVNSDVFDLLEEEHNGDKEIKQKTDSNLLESDKSLCPISDDASFSKTVNSLTITNPLTSLEESNKKESINPSRDRTAQRVHSFADSRQSFSLNFRNSHANNVSRLPQQNNSEINLPSLPTGSISAHSSHAQTKMNTNLPHCSFEDSMRAASTYNSNIPSNTYSISPGPFYNNYFPNSTSDGCLLSPDSRVKPGWFTNSKINGAIETKPNVGLPDVDFVANSQVITTGETSAQQQPFQDSAYGQNCSYPNKLSYFSTQDNFSQLDSISLENHQQSYQPYC